LAPAADDVWPQNRCARQQKNARAQGDGRVRHLRNANDHEGHASDEANRKIKGKGIEQKHENDSAPGVFLKAR